MSKIYFIGAGPGDPELITVKGMKLLQQADVVLYDALISKEILNYCPQAKLYYVGKRCGEHNYSQVQINQLLVECSYKYNLVVRLKGGDPMIFARIAEEMAILKKKNILFEIIPGVTAATAAAARLEIPLTKRGVCKGVQLRTLASQYEKINDLSLKNFVTEGSISCNHIEEQDTLVFYMSKKQIIQIHEYLMGHKFKPESNVSLIESISLPTERYIHIKLAQLPTDIVKNWIQEDAPLLLIAYK